MIVQSLECENRIQQSAYLKSPVDGHWGLMRSVTQDIKNKISVNISKLSVNVQRGDNVQICQQKIGVFAEGHVIQALQFSWKITPIPIIFNTAYWSNWIKNENKQLRIHTITNNKSLKIKYNKSEALISPKIETQKGGQRCTTTWRLFLLIVLPRLSRNTWRLNFGKRTTPQSAELGCGIAYPLAPLWFQRSSGLVWPQLSSHTIWLTLMLNVFRSCWEFTHFTPWTEK